MPLLSAAPNFLLGSVFPPTLFLVVAATSFQLVLGRIAGAIVVIVCHYHMVTAMLLCTREDTGCALAWEVIFARTRLARYYS